MPNITFFIAAENMPRDEVLRQLTSTCTELCTGTLKAALANVHIIYLAVQQGRGHPVFAELQYRLEPFRTAEVMSEFMEKLDIAIARETHFTARIRCFGYGAQSIFARN